MPARVSALVAMLVVPSAVLCAVPAGAQVLVGVVTDSLERPLRDADVIAGQLGQRARTDSTGRFSLRFRSGGRVELVVRLIGYRQHLDTVRVPAVGSVRVAVRMVRLPQRLAATVIIDRRQCDEFALSGFECRRDSGIGYFRDAGELRAMRPRHWADMLDGMPGLRRRPTLDPGRMGWDVAPVPSRCLREIWNGQLPLSLAGQERSPDKFWDPEDVVAIEYYAEYRDVPPQYQRYAWWPPIGGQPCGLIVYWLRGADRVPPPKERRGRAP